ncbi:carboxypeptidase-like regulatory domain-containing protein [Mucilaginibacter sp. CAU 1740]|uniref:carboxypeptidase-like regulatory domain-containing protein n=1 Tax=Mucilaginibacter sp. CAU 1740 TaxID=3140365 RepID=UPI00325B074B
MKKALTIILSIITLGAFAQQQIKGKVTDEKGKPLANASVFVAQSKSGTITDSTGTFTLYFRAKGDFKLVASYVGYTTSVKQISAGPPLQDVSFTLNPVNHQLKDVIVKSRSDDNWKRWGALFTTHFIGTSVFAAHCTIVNHEVIGFQYDELKKELHAYASEPITIRNEDLGYNISLTLVNFTLYTINNDVDYQGYYLFKEITGDQKQQDTWEQNRLKAYSLSFMHFTRALYSDKLKEEGYEVRPFSNKINPEKERVKKLYSQNLARYQDTAKKPLVEKQIAAKLFNKDSLKYYKKILEQEDNIIKLGDVLKAKDISSKTNNNITLQFKDALQVVYKKIKEPEEYYNYRNQNALGTETFTAYNNSISTNQLVMPPKQYPFTELRLEKGIPVEIAENGYFNNTNLYLQGFWGWWEKIATKLPYDYEP